MYKVLQNTENRELIDKKLYLSTCKMECFKCSINLCKAFCARVISFLRVRTDRQRGFWNPHMETCRHTKNFNTKLRVSCRSLYASPDHGDA